MKGFTPFPAELAQRYRREGYWTGEVLGDIARDWARREPGRTALVTAERRWTYEELDGRADSLATGLADLGVAKGDRVVVQLPNSTAFVVVSLALFRLGALPVFAVAAHRRSEIEYLCAHAEAVAYVAPDVWQSFDYRELAAEVQAAVPTLRTVLIDGDAGGHPFTPLANVSVPPRALPGPAPSDIAFFLLSGGTTGTPKLIPRTHDDYAYQLRATAAGLRFDERGVYLAALPAAHNAALGCPGVLGALKAGGKVVLVASAGPDEVFPLIEREGVTLTTLMPPFVQLWLDVKEFLDVDLSGLLLQVGGAKMTPSVASRVVPELGCRLTHWFGMAEGLLTFTRLDDPNEVIVHTQGRPLCPADEIRIVGDDGDDVAAGEVGELWTRGPYTLRGYYKADDHNAKAFTPDGWFRSGDLVRVRPDGNMVVEGRIKDLINRGGEKVSAEELEDHLHAHPAIRQAAVVAMPDRSLGEKTCAFVLARGEAPALAEFHAFLRGRGLADYKLPDRLEVVAELPKTKVGKVDKARLRQTVAEAAGVPG